MREGDVVLAAIPQADRDWKKRPAILLREMPPYGDYLACGLSTQLQQSVDRFDELIQPADPDFDASGLLSSSLIRLGFLAILPRKHIIGSIGVISHERHHRLLGRLRSYLVEHL